MPLTAGSFQGLLQGLLGWVCALTLWFSVWERTPGLGEWGQLEHGELLREQRQRSKETWVQTGGGSRRSEHEVGSTLEAVVNSPRKNRIVGPQLFLPLWWMVQSSTCPQPGMRRGTSRPARQRFAHNCRADRASSGLWRSRWGLAPCLAVCHRAGW